MPARPKLVYLIGEDWFFCSHFLPMGRAALEAGFEVVLLTRPGDRKPDLEAQGYRVIYIDFARNELSPLRKWSTIREIAAVLSRERPAILHNMALGYALVGTVAGRLVGVPAIVNSITGLGHLFIERSASVRALRWALLGTLPFLFNTRRTHLVVENPDDAEIAVGRRWTTLDRITTVPGSGVDVAHFMPIPEPSSPPVRIALVGRMVWQKGPDLAAEAYRILRRRGLACELWLVGRADPGNPRAVPDEQLQRWGKRKGVRCYGFSSDVREIWRDCHIALAPSRGREGLPRSLIEAAACGRPLVGTDIPGTREVARPGLNGILVPPDDPRALADALEQLVKDPELRATYGRASRALAESEFRDSLVGSKIGALYSSLIGPRESR